MKIKEKRSVKANNFFSQKSYYNKQTHPLPPVVLTGTISKRASLTYHFILFYKRLNYDLHFVFPLLPFLFYWTILIIFAFAFHAKSFAILFLDFSFFSFPSLLVNVLSKVIKKACDQHLTHCLDTLKTLSSSYYSWRLWHMTRVMHGNHRS